MLKSFLIIALFFISSCTFKKVSNCTFINQNDYPIEVTMITNNVNMNFGKINSMDTLKKIYEWTNLEKKDGAYQFKVKNLNTNETLDFTDAMYVGGELTNYIEAYFVGETIQMKASN